MDRIWHHDTFIDCYIHQLADIVGTREVDVCDYERDLQSLLDCLLGVEPTTSSRMSSSDMSTRQAWRSLAACVSSSSAYSRCSGVGAGNDSALA